MVDAKNSARRLAGAVVVEVPQSLRATGLAIVAIVLLAGGIASNARYARRETVTGWITLDTGIIRVNARQGGLVERLAVTEGEALEAGETLADLRLSESFDGSDTGVSLQTDLKNESDALSALQVSEASELDASTARIRSQLLSVRDEVAELERGLQVMAQQREVQAAQLSRLEELYDQGFLSQRSLDERRSALLAVEQQISSARASLIARRGQANDLALQASAVTLERGSMSARNAQAAAALRQRRTNQITTSRYQIAAPLTGRVAVLPVRVGQVANAGDTIAIIIPSASRLQAELYVPSRASGFLKEGQHVRLMVQAFPYQKFGTVPATISAITPVALAPGEIQAPGIVLQEPTVRVIAQVDRESVTAYGEQIGLSPGMLLEADIVLDQRTLLEWLFDPILAAGHRR